MNPRAKLRRLLEEEPIVVAPGAFDCLSARLIQQAGFSAAYLTGYGSAASYLGVPDVGLLSFAEMASQARRVAASVSIPVLADADTGYGNPINVTRTVREYERAGVAGLHIEDQVWPKRCGHMEGKQVIPKEEMVQKVRAACAAREDPDFLIVARTDARAVHGLEEALERARAYAQAGADMLFVEGPATPEEAASIAQELKDYPLLYNRSGSGKAALLTVPELRGLGYKLVIFPTQALYVAAHAIMQMLTELKIIGSPDNYATRMPTFEQFNALVGLGEVQRLEREYGTV